jgi:alkanesulfonate monooxygenase SsuD/methylene tetrahydromethanopterin reductase-like flavin-dependent oxidoreductase (luciferase family)
MMLGVFLNLQDIQRSSLPSSNTWTFDYNAAIVQQVDALGFELAFSWTQWLPKEGYDGEASLDAFVALSAMAAITKRILLISTIHVLYGPIHPLHLAKYGATLEIVGSPEQVIEQLVALKAAGIDGVQLGFFDFAVDLEHFDRRILPLMKQAGLRH